MSLTLKDKAVTELLKKVTESLTAVAAELDALPGEIDDVRARAAGGRETRKVKKNTFARRV